MTEIVDAEIVEETRNLPAVRAGEAIVARGELSVEEVVEQKDKIVQIMHKVMTPNVHYGRIPGIDKPSLFKPGAEAINVALRLAPHYTSDKIWHDDGHLTVTVACELRHIPTGLVIATGEGLCSSKEAKYAYRTQKKKCPACGAEAIIKGKAQYGGGWICWKKEGGCGAKYADADTAIVDQAEGKIANPDLADTWNTVLKMADKRALVAAVLNGTAASDVFTQDVEEQATPQPQDDVPFEASPVVESARGGGASDTSPAQGQQDHKGDMGTDAGTGGLAVEAKVTEALEITARLGEAAHETMVDEIARRRAEGKLTERWLNNCIKAAREKLPAEEPRESIFEEMVPESVKPK